MLKKNTMNQRIKSVVSLLLKTESLIALISIFFIVVTVVLTYHIRPFNSDDVSWQTALLSWRPFTGHVLYWSPDTWIIKLPFFIFLGHFFEPGRRLLLLESLTFAVINFILFYVATLYFLKKMKVKINKLTLLPVIWLSSFGFLFVRLFLNTNLRNIEIGLSFILFMVVAKIYYGEIRPFKTTLSSFITTVACFIVGTLIYNDPFFLYFTLAPIVFLCAFLLINKVEERKKLLSIIGMVLLSFVFFEIVAKICYRAGIHPLGQNIQFAQFSQVFPQVATTIQATMTIFGSDFTGRSVINLITVGFVLNFVLVAFVIRFLFKDFWKTSLNNDNPNLWKKFFSFLSLFILAVYTFSSLDVNLGTYRYLILLPFIFVILLITNVNGLPKSNRMLINFVLCACIIFNLSITLSAMKDPGIFGNANVRNVDNFVLIDSLEKHGLTKGYGQYWDANINSYLSKGSLTILPAVCINNTEQRFDWMINSALFSKHENNKTFFIYDRDFANSTPECSISEIEKQLGKPMQSYNISNETVFIYNYDISSKIP
jgi:hypothetical protein